MASISSRGGFLLIFCLAVVFYASPAAAFGAGNIPGISTVEGHNWRHGDIEDMLKTVAFLKGYKWTSMLIKRVYFGNWLRDYSQAVDVGSLKGASAPTIRILVWVLAFLSFGYATEEFEVTEERLGVYRPEEHIDNPKDYADNQDARKYDGRLRGPIQKAELEVDHNTGMKNYIANEAGGWATSTGYVKFSLSRSIHFGRVYTHGASGTHGREADLCEALRCLGQGLHCLEDFGAHTNYCELALRELGFREVFPHTGNATEINIRGQRIFPITTGTFGAVDFLHSVLGEATDHFTQSEVDELDIALKNAEAQNSGTGQRGFFGTSSGGGLDEFTSLLSQIPGHGGNLAVQARDLQAQSQAQEHLNQTARASVNTDFQAFPGSTGGPPGTGVPGMRADFDPVKTAAQIYPILEFRDKIVKAINATIAKIPGLEALVEKISEMITVFILSLLSPFIRPVIEAVSKSLKEGSTSVVQASADQQYGPWNDPTCSDPTHSMLSKDHFSNYLNPCAGRVAATILQYVVPRVLYAWEHPGVPVDEVMNDILRTFHHPALRNENIEIHRNMFNTVRRWVDEHPNKSSINGVLSSSSVKAGKNHKEEKTSGITSGSGAGHSHNAFGGYGQAASSVWSKIQSRDLGAMRDIDGTSRGMSPPGSPGLPPGSPGFGYSSTATSVASQHGLGDPYLNPERPSSSSFGGSDYYQAAPSATSYQPQSQGQQPYQSQPNLGGYGGYATNPGYAGPGYGPPPPGPFGGGPGFGPPPPSSYGPPFMEAGSPQQQGYPPQYPQNPYPNQGPPYPSQGYPGQGYSGQGYPPGYGRDY